MIFRLKGGLGNLMFQYIAALSLSKITGRGVKFETYRIIKNDNIIDPLFNAFGIRIENNISPAEKIAARIFFSDKLNRILDYEKLKNLGIFREEYSHPSDNPFSVTQDSKKYRFYDGYWQDYRLHEIANIDPANIFEFRTSEKDVPIKIQELKCEHQLVALHVRRGDYLLHPEVYSCLDINYYSRAISYFRATLTSPFFLVFSDDTNWAVNNLNLGDDFYIASKKGMDAHEDMRLMSLCNHHIIANSTYSWWSARLNKSDEKTVIMPKTWFVDSSLNAMTSGLRYPGWLEL